MIPILIAQYKISAVQDNNLKTIYDELGIIAFVVLLITTMIWIVTFVTSLIQQVSVVWYYFIGAIFFISIIMLFACLQKSTDPGIRCGVRVVLENGAGKITETCIVFTGQVELDRARVETAIKDLTAIAHQRNNQDKAVSERINNQKKECCMRYKEVMEGVK